jgi:hypothetical protein
VPIQYVDQEELDQLGAAAFLKLEPDDAAGGFRGALLQINARGEPLEFTYNRIATPRPFLWRADDLSRLALARLTASLLDASRNEPTLFCYLADDVPSALFEREIRVQIPVCCVLSAHDCADTESFNWQPSAPLGTSSEFRLARELQARRLLREPFERVSSALREIYASAAEPPS